MEIKFEQLYAQDEQAQKQRYEKIRAGFAACFGSDEDVSFYSAPGRTEVGGNHTDHNHGRVLAAAVNLDIVAAARKTQDNTVRLKSAEYPNMDVIALDALTPQTKETDHSASLIRGVCARLHDLGYKIGGFEAYTATQVLKGSGLSSSAAFEVLVGTIVNHLYNDGKIDAVTIAQTAQYAENVFFGKPSGLMDQTASSVGGFTAIDFADPAHPILEKVDFDLTKSGYALCIVDTGGNHADLTSEYAAIPAEMKKIAALLGKTVLREVDETVFYASIPMLREKAGDRAVLRAMHFFDDNRIAKQEADALKAGDFEQFKACILSSGRSSAQRLQNVFAVVDPAQQGLSVALALTEKLLGGTGAAWRVHGGGFGGTIQAFVPVEKLSFYREEIEKVFGRGHCYALCVRSAGATKVIV